MPRLSRLVSNTQLLKDRAWFGVHGNFPFPGATPLQHYCTVLYCTAVPLTASFHTDVLKDSIETLSQEK